jgi:hypothetical protein
MEESVVMRKEITGHRDRGGDCSRGQAEERRKKFKSEWGFREAARPRTGLERLKLYSLALPLLRLTRSIKGRVKRKTSPTIGRRKMFAMLSSPIYLPSFMRALLVVGVDQNDQNLLQAGALL